MADLRKIGVEAVVENLSGFGRDMKGVNSLIDGLGITASKSEKRFSLFGGVLENIGGIIRRVGEIAAGILVARIFENIASGIASMAREAFEAGSNFQMLKIRLEGLIARDLVEAREGTLSFAAALFAASDASEELFGWIQLLALQTPFDIEDIANTFTLAKSYGFASDKAKDLTKAITDFSSGMGLTELGMRRIIENLGQMVQQGKITGTELRDLGRGSFLPINRLLAMTAERLGITEEAFNKLRKKGLAPVEPFIESFIELVGTDFPNAGKRASRTIQAVIGNFQDLLQGAISFNVIRPILDSVSTALAELLDIATTGARGERLITLFSEIGDALSGILDIFIGRLPSATAVIDGFLDNLEIVAGVLADIKTIVEDLFTGELDLSGAFAELGSALGISGFQIDLSGILEDIGTPQSILDFLRNITDALDNLKIFWDQNSDAILGIFGEIGEALLGTAVGLGEGLLDTVGGLILELSQTIVNNGPQIVDFLQKAADWITEQFLPALVDLMQWITDNKEELALFFLGFKLGIEILKGLAFITGLIVLFGFALGIISIPLVALITLIPILTGLFLALRERVSAAIIMLAIIVFIKFKEMREAIATAWNEIVTSVTLKLAELLVQVVKGIVKIRDFIGEKVDEIKEIFTNIDWNKLGSNIIDGIKRGIQSGIPALIAAAANAARKAFNAFMAALKGKSPSKLFELGGKSIMQGAAKGILDNVELGAQAMNVAVSHMLAPAMQAAPAMSTITNTTINSTRNFSLNVNTSAPVEPLLTDFALLESQESGRV